MCDKLAAVVRVLYATQNMVILQRTAKDCTKIHDVHMQSHCFAL